MLVYSMVWSIIGALMGETAVKSHTLMYHDEITVILQSAEDILIYF